MTENGSRKIRLGMVGGGTGAFIGYVHRIASRIDGDYELVAGALSSRPAVAKQSGRDLGLAKALDDGPELEAGLPRDPRARSRKIRKLLAKKGRRREGRALIAAAR